MLPPICLLQDAESACILLLLCQHFCAADPKNTKVNNSSRFDEIDLKAT
jgi:hypothetical protein